MSTVSKSQELQSSVGQRPLSPRKDAFRRFFDELAPKSDVLKARKRYFYHSDWRYLRFLVPAGVKVLVLGCGTGKTLSELAPAIGVGIDISEQMILQARRSHPQHTF